MCLYYIPSSGLLSKLPQHSFELAITSGTAPCVLAVYRPAAVHEEGVTVAEFHEALVPVESQDGRQLTAGGHLAPWEDARPAKKLCS